MIPWKFYFHQEGVDFIYDSHGQTFLSNMYTIDISRDVSARIREMRRESKIRAPFRAFVLRSRFYSSVNVRNPFRDPYMTTNHLARFPLFSLTVRPTDFFNDVTRLCQIQRGGKTTPRRGD